MKMKLTMNVWQEEEGGVGGSLVEYPAVISHADNEEELAANLWDALRLLLKSQAKKIVAKTITLDCQGEL